MIKNQLEEVRKHIEDACRRAGRNPEEVTLIAVSKTKPVPMLMEAYDAGARDFGENKVQEILNKKPELPEDIRWHMIGHLQRNKVHQVIDKAVLIHSVDSLRLAQQIEADAAKLGLDVDILMEEVEDAIMRIKDFPHVHIKGLMTIAPFVDNPEENRGIFKKLFEFAVDIGDKNIDNVTMSVLSMGMTGDYEVAIEEGATMVRVGTGIFGSR